MNSFVGSEFIIRWKFIVAGCGKGYPGGLLSMMQKRKSEGG